MLRTSARIGLWLVCGAMGLAAVPGTETWTQRGFAELSAGTFAGAGQNIYVSRRGRIQLINRLDLNGDGHVDIAIANGHAKSEKEDLFIYTNRGGDFQSLDRIALPANGAEATAVADLNGDGRPELVLAQKNNGITSRLNAYIYVAGAEGFTPKRRLELPAFGATDVAAADFNGDGLIDLAFACENERGTETASTIYWNAPAGFDAARKQDVLGAKWRRIAASDWDGDGVTDLLAATPNGVHLLRGSRGTTRGLLDPRPLTNVAADTFATGDWNGDRTLDLAVSDGRRLTILIRGAAAGGAAALTPAITVDVANVTSLAAADFDKDGRLDLLAAVRHVSGNEYANSFILWNDAAGLDTRPRTLLPTVSATGAAATDLDDDGFPDAIFSNHHAYNDNDIQSMVYWNSKGAFVTGRKTMLDTRGAAGVTVADINGDTRPDLVFTNTTGGQQEGWSPKFVYWGDGTRNYSTARRTEIPGYYATGSVQADLNDDGFVDLGFNEGRSASGKPGTLHGAYLWWGAKDGYSADRRSILAIDDPAGGIRAADLDRNGYLDLLIGAHDKNGGTKGGFVIFWGDADGYSARRRQVVPLASSTREPTVADVNGDGYLDLLASTTDLNGLSILWGSADGYDAARRTVLGPDRIFAHAEVADLNKDGFLDIVAPTRKLADRTEGDSFVYYGSATGFSESRRTGLPTMAAYDPSVADLNKDGWLDIVFPNYSATWSGKRTLPVFVYWGSEKGFDPARRLELPADAGAASIVTDFDRDGWLDVFIAAHRRDGSTEEAGQPHTHYANSLIYWGGPDGLGPAHRTELPSVGPHSQISVDVGNIVDREMAEYYVSPAWRASDDGKRVSRIAWEAETPHGTTVKLQIRTAASKDALTQAPWTGPSGPNSWFDAPAAAVRGGDGPWVQYRARLGTPDGGATPYLTSVSIDVR